MSETVLSFAPAAVDRDIEELSRPSLSYWQDAWIRFKANRRALASLIVVALLILFAIAGPWVWPIDHYDQDLDQTSKPPWADRTVTVLEPYAPLPSIPSGTPSSNPTSVDSVEVIGDPTSSYVRLLWSSAADATSYQLYRNIIETTEDSSPGVPLTKVTGSANTFYEDRLDLRPRTYWYTVVPIDLDGNSIGNRAVVQVEVPLTTTVEEAVASGWIDADNSYQPGDTFELPWHQLGTDYLGRDMLARLMEGARISLFIGVVAPVFFVLVGILYGSIAGFAGGVVDQALMRFADFVVALPFLLFMILFKIVFGIESGSSGIFAMMVALVLLGWPATARLVRGQILQIREEGYVSASRLLGTKSHRLILRHMIPNTLGVILVTLTFAVPSTIFTEAFLSFIGMGVEPPNPSWGSMCNDGRKTMETAPHELIFPAVIISITVLAFNILGDGLRDALDARMRSTE